MKKEYLALEIWFVKTELNILRSVVQEHFPKPSGSLSTLSICLTVMRFAVPLTI